MMKAAIYQCPTCGGAINRENFAEATIDGRVDAFLLCDFCGIGVETSTYADGEVFVLDFHASTEPNHFASFKDRLIAARAA